MDPHDPPVYAQQALAVYAESLAVGKRVAVFGDASLGIGERLGHLGARTVHVWDPDFVRARFEASRAPRGVVVRTLVDDDVEVRDGAFDLAIVPDLGLFRDPDALLERVRRLVGADGAALVAAGASETARRLDYYELFDRVAREFQEVRMIAQLPFNGVALAELGDENDSPAVTVDTQLADADRTPRAFVALASQRGVRLDAYAIIELPPAVPEEERREDEEDDEQEVEDEHDWAEAEDRQALSGALLEAGLRAEALEAQVEELRAHLAAALQVARAAEPLESALRESSSRLVELEHALGVRARQVADLSNEAEALRDALQAGRVAASLVAPLEARAERAEGALDVLQSELQRASDAHAAELGRYEEGLRERAQTIRLLEAELARREQMVRDLIDALEEGGGRLAGTTVEGFEPAHSVGPSEHDALAAENAQLRGKLDELALELARRLGEAQAAAWSVAELERRLAAVQSRAAPEELAPSQTAPQAADPAPPPAPTANGETERRLGDALEELNVLRRALTQEHEARLRAEAGDELARAREEIQRQAVLLEQLRAPLI